MKFQPSVLKGAEKITFLKNDSDGQSLNKYKVASLIKNGLSVVILVFITTKHVYLHLKIDFLMQVKKFPLITSLRRLKEI